MASEGDGRALDVLAFAGARATEVRATVDTVQDHPEIGPGGLEGSHRGNRRRANSHKPRLSNRRRPNAKRQKAKQEPGEDSFPNNRNMRRRRGRLQERIEREFRDPNERSDRSLRLVTHRWHAKRFEMETKWNVKVPKHVLGKGKGIKSVLRATRTKAVLHDASYVFPIFLSGKLEHRLQLLTKLSDPNTIPAGRTKREEAELEGTAAFHTMLHRCEEFPAGAIGPVQVLWNVRVQQPEGEGVQKQTWVLVHAAAYKSALHEMSKVAESLHVSVQAGQGSTCTIQLYGQASHEVLTSVLCNSICQESRNGKVWKSFCKCSGADCFPNRAICGFHMHDARLADRTNIATLSNCNTSDIHLPQWRKTNNRTGPKWRWPREEPVNQHQIGKIRCQRRRDYLQLGGEEVLGDAHTRTCPLLLFQIEGRAQGHAGWSILVPSLWCASLWHTLVGRGARAVGLEEWNWILTRGQISIFPEEFPETEAGRTADFTSPAWPVHTEVIRNATDMRWKCIERPPIPAKESLHSLSDQFTKGGCNSTTSLPGTPLAGDRNVLVKVAISLIRRGACSRGWVVLGASEEEFLACRRKQFRTKTNESTEPPIGWVTSSVDCTRGTDNVAFAMCSLEKLLWERGRQQGWARLWSSGILVILARSHPGSQRHAGIATICLEGINGLERLAIP